MQKEKEDRHFHVKIFDVLRSLNMMYHAVLRHSFYLTEVSMSFVSYRSKLRGGEPAGGSFCQWTSFAQCNKITNSGVSPAWHPTL